MSYEVLAGEDRAYCLGDDVTPDQHAEKLNAEIVEFKLHPEKCNGNKVTHYNIDLQIILRCFETGENDTLEPTAEWSRIQQALNERDEFAEVIKCQDEYRKKLESERDELKTELEMAEAERDRFRDLVNKTEQMRQDKIEELASLKSRLPVNADGDVPTIDDSQFMMDDEGQVIEFFIVSMHRESGEIYLSGHVSGEGFGVVTPLISQCHSSAESCRAANTQEGERWDG